MLFLHIGSHKAGSTTIQHFLRDNEAQLRRHGIIYPAAGRGSYGAHHVLAAQIARGDGDSADWATLRRVRSEAPRNRVVLSSEGLENLSPELIERLKDRAGGGRISIIYYFRDHANFVRSVYAQRTRIGASVMDFDAFFDLYIATDQRKGNRAQRLLPWVRTFGLHWVRVRLLDASSLTGGNLLDDLLSLLSIPDPAGAGFDTSMRRNASPSWQVTETMRAMFDHLRPLQSRPDGARLIRFAGLACEEAAAELGMAAEPGHYLTVEQQRLCDELTIRDIEAINHFLPRHALTYPHPEQSSERPFLPSVGHVPSADVAALLTRTLLAVAEEQDRQPRKEDARRRAAAVLPA